MATHDYVIANGTGAAVRSDLNNALAAIVSNNSSSSEPATTYAYQWWADTNTNVLKIRNSANNGWVSLRELDGTMLIEDGSASTPGLAFADDTNTGIFSGGADEINIATGGTERVVVNSSGKVGVGSTAPDAILEVGGVATSGETEAFAIERSDGVDLYRINYDPSTNSMKFQANNKEFAFQNKSSFGESARIDDVGRVGIGTSNPSTKFHLKGGDSDFITLEHATRTGSWFIEHSGVDSQGLVFKQDNGTSTVASYLAGRDFHYFYTGGTQRMYVDSSGNAYFGTGSAGQVGLTIYAPGTTSRLYFNRSGTTATSTALEFADAGSTKGSITYTNTATSYNTSSDYRLKENVTPVTDGITRLQQLKPSRFNFIADPDTTVDGFLAHEAQTVVPEAVTGIHNEVDDDGNAVYQGIDQSKLVPLLTAALQEAIAKIETLETKVAALEAG